MLWLRILYINNVIYYDKRFVLLHYYFPKLVRSVQYGCFCSSLISCFPIAFLEFCVSDFEMIPVAPGIIFIVTFHKRFISNVKFYSLKPFLLLYWSHFYLLKLKCLLTRIFSFSRYHDCDVLFIVRDSSVSLHFSLQNKFTLLSWLVMAKPLFLV